MAAVLVQANETFNALPVSSECQFLHAPIRQCVLMALATVVPFCITAAAGGGVGIHVCRPFHQNLQ